MHATKTVPNKYFHNERIRGQDYLLGFQSGCQMPQFAEGGEAAEARLKKVCVWATS